MSMSHSRFERRAPGVADEDDLVATELLPEMVDDNVQISEMARDGLLMRIGFGIERTTRSPLVPVGYHDVIFRGSIVVPEQRSLRRTGAAVQPEQEGARLFVPRVTRNNLAPSTLRYSVCRTAIIVS